MKEIVGYLNVKPNVVIAIVVIVAIVASLLCVTFLNKRVVKVNIFNRFTIEAFD